MLKIVPKINFKATADYIFLNFRKWSSDFFKSFLKHDLMTLAAALAFYTALALAPLLLITMSVIGSLGVEAKDLLITQIQSLAGPEASAAIVTVIEAAQNQPQKSGVAGFFGVLVLLFSASGVFAHLQSSLNVIWGVEDKKKLTEQKSWLKKRILSLGMILSLGFLALVSLFTSAVLSVFFTEDGSVLQVLNSLVSIVIFTSMFAFIYKFLPDERLSWRHAWAGGMVTAVLFMIGKFGIGIYLKENAVGSAYGAAGSIIVLLAWVYYSAIVVFSGAEVTRLVSIDHSNKSRFTLNTHINANINVNTQQRPIININQEGIHGNYRQISVFTTKWKNRSRISRAIVRIGT